MSVEFSLIKQLNFTEVKLKQNLSVVLIFEFLITHI